MSTAATTTTPLTICTHSGTFHADEALACFLLKLTDTYKDAVIVRSRDPAVVNAADITVDVGAVYDFEKKRFDHHQAGFTHTFDDKHETKLSSAGLIYKFDKAMAVMGETFLDKVDYYGKSWLPARSIVESALKLRKDIHPSGSIILLEAGCPYKEHLYDLEREMEIEPIKFALAQDSLGSWRVMAINVDSGSFDLRLALPEAWRGKRDKVLSEIVGLDGCIFARMYL
eukprot:gene11984-13991_t